MHDSAGVLEAFNWHIFRQYLLPPDHRTLAALLVTFSCAVISQTLGNVLGLISALMQMTRHAVVRGLATVYVWIIRGTPLVVQIFFIYFGVNLLFGINLIPRNLSLFGASVSGAILAGIAALTINEGAYMSEIIRAGIGAIDRGQLESAQALGMRRRLAMRRIVLPQAARVIVPPLGNEFNNMLKSTSLLSFIGVNELFNDAQERYSATFQPVEYLLGVAVLYLLLTTIWSLIQRRIEARLSASDRGVEVGDAERGELSWRKRVLGLGMVTLRRS